MLTDKYVFIEGEMAIRMQILARGQHKYYLSKDTFMVGPAGIACTSGSPLKMVIDKV